MAEIGFNTGTKILLQNKIELAQGVPGLRRELELIEEWAKYLL